MSPETGPLLSKKTTEGGCAGAGRADARLCPAYLSFVECY
jgi:hypothetical protein